MTMFCMIRQSSAIRVDCERSWDVKDIYEALRDRFPSKQMRTWADDFKLRSMHLYSCATRTLLICALLPGAVRLQVQSDMRRQGGRERMSVPQKESQPGYSEHLERTRLEH